MKIKQSFQIISVSIDGFEFQAPEGLAEVLNRNNAWEYVAPDEKKSSSSLMQEYDRKVVYENGTLSTVLTYKGKAKQIS
ncbi:hypothetical protein [Bacillus massiliglaciei]|uniref:hypothetical protein n=1 Tax=Bacillus massiliglaciei TaxID=1816693 RepID=UPI000DA6157C|nr:hypothetical protein [Bacillus massiliglaciei]